MLQNWVFLAYCNSLFFGFVRSTLFRFRNLLHSMNEDALDQVLLLNHAYDILMYPIIYDKGPIECVILIFKLFQNNSAIKEECCALRDQTN